VTGNVYFAETFESEADFKQRLVTFVCLVKCRVEYTVVCNLLSLTCSCRSHLTVMAIFTFVMALVFVCIAITASW